MNSTMEYYEGEYELIDRPLWWHKQDLTQTASGYGKKLTSSHCARLSDGKVRRIYVTQSSNAGTAWVIVNGRRLVLR